MTDYLDHIGTGIILDNADAFNFDFVPPALVGREQLQRELASKFITIAQPEGSGRVVLTGPVGSGKTVLIRRFCEDVQRKFADQRPIRSAHINCRNASTSMQVVQRIVHTLDPGHPDRGLSIGELLNSIRKLLDRTSSHLIVVLDEVDHVLRRSGDELLYHLLRIDEDQRRNGSVSLILISQEQVLDFLEPAVISRLGQSNHIRVAPYTVDELEEIALQRAEIGLVEGTWDFDVIRLIAEKAGPSGDARRVIEYLNAAVERCEFRQDGVTPPYLTIQDVHDSSEFIAYNVSTKMDHVDDLSGHAMMTLLAICRRLKKSPTMTMGDVSSLYHLICEEYEQKPKSHTTMWKYVKHLEHTQIVVSTISTVEDGRGRTTHLTMPHFLPADIASRLEMLIPKRLR
ncbi:MAG: AAA family ATPase [archaeon]|nr:AAA family ATPase [archaeon]MDA0843000.1 AAA family ATPase [archaeon]MDA1167812.1 AAA family ATPase [archaeon]